MDRGKILKLSDLYNYCKSVNIDGMDVHASECVLPSLGLRNVREFRCVAYYVRTGTSTISIMCGFVTDLKCRLTAPESGLVECFVEERAR